MNVLLVDDEPYMLEQLEMLIKPLCPFWNLYTAADSSQALYLSKEIQFQLAFLDIEMPGKSGLELAHDLKKLDAKLEIIIISAHQDFDYAKKAISIGVSEYITKPIVESEIKEVVQRHAKDIYHLEYSKIVNDTLAIVHEQFQEKLNLSTVADKIHVNASYLSRKFSEEVGLPFSDYLLNYRVEVAKTKLLTQMDNSISEVAEEVGFNSLHYFSTIFKKKVGMTAKKYREMGK
jgi:two-component system response regulator YesN